MLGPVISEAHRTGTAHRLRRMSELLTASGLAGTVLVARRHRGVAMVSGAALLVGSELGRLRVASGALTTWRSSRIGRPHLR